MGRLFSSQVIQNIAGVLTIVSISVGFIVELWDTETPPPGITAPAPQTQTVSAAIIPDQTVPPMTTSTATTPAPAAQPVTTPAPTTSTETTPAAAPNRPTPATNTPQSKGLTEKTVTKPSSLRTAPVLPRIVDVEQGSAPELDGNGNIVKKHENIDITTKKYIVITDTTLRIKPYRYAAPVARIKVGRLVTISGEETPDGWVLVNDESNGMKGYLQRGVDIKEISQ